MTKLSVNPLWCKPPVKPPINGFGVDANRMRKLRSVHCAAKKLNYTGVPTVAILLCNSCPPYISWLVVPRWVYSVKRVLLAGFHANIANKILKRRTPRFANGNASCPVILESGAGFLVAAAAHINPSEILGRFRKSMCSMARTAFAAAFHPSGNQRVSSHDRGVSASTFTKPIPTPLIGRGLSQRKYTKKTKRLTGNVNAFHAFIVA